MTTTKYTLSIAADFSGLFDSDGWAADLATSSIATPVDLAAGGVNTSGDVVTTWFSAELSPADVLALFTLASSHYSRWREPIIADVAAHRDHRLASVIRVEYPVGSGSFFSCSRQAQDDWNKLVTLDQLGMVSFPFQVWTHDHGASVAIIDAMELATIVSLISATVMVERAAANAAASAVANAIDEAAASAAAAPYLQS